MIGPVKVELTADQVDVLDAAALSVVTMSDASGLIRVPRYLAIHKPAGDAYTVGDDAKICVVDEDASMWFCTPAKGFLDSALAQSKVTAAALSGTSLNAANKTLSVRIMGGSIAKGASSPVLRLAIYFDHFQAVW